MVIFLYISITIHIFIKDEGSLMLVNIFLATALSIWHLWLFQKKLYVYVLSSICHFPKGIVFQNK